MSSIRKTQLLGMPIGTASHRLRKAVLFNILQETGRDSCFQCGQTIVTVDDLSMEHKQPWQTAADPKAMFFDVKNIAFSHLMCNIRAKKQSCPQEHPYSADNTYTRPGGGAQVCLKCRRETDVRRWPARREYRRRQ